MSVLALTIADLGLLGGGKAVLEHCAQGVPQFQAQYIKQNTPATIAILINFTYMVANEVL